MWGRPISDRGEKEKVAIWDRRETGRRLDSTVGWFWTPEPLFFSLFSFSFPFLKSFVYFCKKALNCFKTILDFVK
jgi:hypothetical protein